MKKHIVILASLALAACSSSESNLIYSTKPILNMTANIAPFVDVQISEKYATVKNKTTEPLNVNYHLYWYDALGVTQTWENQKESDSGKLLLQSKEQKAIELIKPTAESKNYRLYLQ